MKQGWHLNEKTFMPTSNARNSAMLKEAATFADHLKHCEKDIRTLKNSSEGEHDDARMMMHVCQLFHSVMTAPQRSSRPWTARMY